MGALDQFKGGYQINESLNDSFEQTTDPLKDLDGKGIKLDGGGLYNTKNKKEEDFVEPEDMLDPSLNITEEEAKKEAYEMYSNHGNKNNDYISGEEMHEYIELNSKTEEEIVNTNHSNINDFSDTATEEEYIKNQEMLKIKETKEYPLVKNYLEEKNIVVDNLSLDKDGKININSIDGLSIDDKEKLNGLLFNIEGENKGQNRINLSESIKDLSEFEEYNLEMTDNGFEDGVLNRIGENYLQIPDKDGNIDVKKNISTAIEMAKNQICLDAKNFNRDSQTYKTAIININSGNLKKQLEGINSLYYLAFSKEGELGAKDSLNAYKNKRKKELIRDANILEAKQQLALKNKNNEEFKKLDKQKDVIIKEVEELIEGDIFKSGENDKISEKDPLIYLEQN